MVLMTIFVKFIFTLSLHFHIEILGIKNKHSQIMNSKKVNYLEIFGLGLILRFIHF